MFLDQTLFFWLYNLSHKNWILDQLLIFVADYLIYFFVIIFLYLLLKERNWRRRSYLIALAIISAILSRGILTELIRFYYYRPRPFIDMDIQPLIHHAATSSFPSGHLALFPLVLVAWMMNRRAGFLFLAGALLMGVARVASGIHWPTDVLGGILIGTISFFIVYYLLKIKGLPGNSANQVTGHAPYGRVSHQD